MGMRQNVANPQGVGGRITLNRMNQGAHAELSKWGFSQLELSDYRNILDIGCGGGANVAKLLAGSPDGHVTGVDFSDLSVKTSRKYNAQEIKAGRCVIRKENVSHLSFADNTFDLATAFETIYFWPGLADSFAQVCRVLIPGGRFLICNETDGEDPEGYQWAEEIKGLTIYRESEVTDYLKQAGFLDVTTARCQEKHWICFIAEK